MSVRHFGWMPDGTQVLEASLSSDAGARCHVITYGGAVRDLLVPLADDHLRRVVLGFQTLDGYLADRNYIGVTVGRTASRIRRGRIRVDERDYQLASTTAVVRISMAGRSGSGHAHGASSRPRQIRLC